MILDQVSTAKINPSPYFREGGIAFGKFAIIALLAICVFGGFWLRSANLSDESLGRHV